MFRKRGILGRSKVSASVSAKSIRSIVEDYEANGREYCLDVGSTEWLDDKYESVNFKKFEGLTYYGDIRTMFSPGYMDDADRYPDLARIVKGKYKLIRAVDVVEHIEWIHQPFLFRWLRELLVDGGLLYIITPNLDFITQLYARAMKKLSAGKSLDGFPFDEHAYTKAGEPFDIARWTNSILYAGCSSMMVEDQRRGDFHHCCYNKIWLEAMLSRTDMSGGFTNIRIHCDQRLEAIAQKPFDVDSGSESLVKRMLP